MKLRSFLEAAMEVDKHLLLDMQTLIIDELDPDAEVNLVRGTETRLKSSIWHSNPWVVEVTFSNGNYKIFGQEDAIDSSGRFNKKIFTDKVKRFLPGSINSQRQALWQQLKSAFGKAFRPSNEKGSGIVYSSPEDRAKHEEVEKVANDAHKNAITNARANKGPLADISGAYDVYKATKAEHSAKLKPLLPYYQVGVVNKGTSEKNGVNGFAIKIAKVPTDAASVAYVATVPEAVAKLKELFQS